jgi:hypothetical protein
MAKNMPAPLLALAVPAHAAVLVCIGVRMLLGQRGRRELKPMLRGLRDALAGLGAALAERRRLQASRALGWRAVARALCWSPLRFLRRAADLRPL